MTTNEKNSVGRSLCLSIDWSVDRCRIGFNPDDGKIAIAPDGFFMRYVKLFQEREISEELMYLICINASYIQKRILRGVLILWEIGRTLLHLTIIGSTIGTNCLWYAILNESHCYIYIVEWKNMILI